MAGAGLDEHHLPGEHVSFGTLKLHRGCDAGRRRAAAAVSANATELGFVQPAAGAARQSEAHPVLGFGSPDTFLSFLDVLLLLAVAGSHHADPGLPLQLAALVVVGDAG